MQVEVQNQLRQMAREVVSQISALESLRTKELLGVFVSELFDVVAEADSKAKRRQRQAEGIVAAKARGVRFGPARKPLPENFTGCYEAWQSGQMTLTQAAEACGISRDTFRRTIDRMKESDRCSA